MNAWSPHRRWIAGMGVTLAILSVAFPLWRSTRAHLRYQCQRMAQQRTDVQKALANLRHDAATAESLNRSIGAQAMAFYLAPVDRLAITGTFETLACASRLTKFTYTLSPSKPYRPYPANPDAHGLVQSALTLEAQTPQDLDAFQFVHALLRSLPGRASLQRLTVTRLDADGVHALKPVNLAFSASIDWLANDEAKSEKNDGKNAEEKALAESGDLFDVEDNPARVGIALDNVSEISDTSGASPLDEGNVAINAINAKDISEPDSPTTVRGGER